MLARRMTGILPELSVEDQQEALCIHSVLGENIDGLLAGHRPFRSPHHSISTAGLIGGGRPVHPGEISLAHGGVLFLDELAEFPTGVLQTLRQPIERGYVRIVRVVRIARTIADVAESEQVTQDHVLEAAMYQGRRDQ